MGIDISEGMVARARNREVYDEARAVNIHDGLGQVVPKGSMDVVICTGAMELLDHSFVLDEFATVLAPKGRLWVSMQWEGAIDEEGKPMSNPTRHQNVFGTTREKAGLELATAGFRIVSIEECPSAYRTPSPTGDGELLPVPYLFIEAEKTT